MLETAIGCGCGPCACSCGDVPAEFVRVRYYFGQRLGVMELNDEALYHAAKMAFHNARLHGFGVLCGLRADRQKPPAAGAQSTVLRVTSGAALDPCGREIAVGIDQCIDVAAWFAKNKKRLDASGWTAGADHTLRVAVRYRECPSDPSPAPRDACGCDNGGCEYGRVREAFELQLFTVGESACGATPFPKPADLLAALEGGSAWGTAADPDVELDGALDTLVAAGCPAAPDDTWLCLASFEVTLDATPVPVDISDPDNAIPERRTLLPSNALQAMVLDLAASGVAAGSLGGGPRAGALSLTAATATAGTLVVPIRLARSGSPPADVPLVAGTFEPAFLAVSRLDPAGWTILTPSSVTYQATPPRIEVVFTADLEDKKSFVLAFQPDPIQPTVDENGAPLPAFTRHFRFALDGGVLVPDPTV